METDPAAGTQAALDGIVAELVRGFAMLVRAEAASMRGDRALELHAVVARLAEATRSRGWDEEADLLRGADDVLAARIPPID